MTNTQSSSNGKRPQSSDVRSSARWNALSLGGRQGLRAITSLIIAGVVGQDAYGIIGLATLYVGFAFLFVQFGFGTALVQRADLRPGHIGAATRLSIGAGLSFAAITIVAAPFVADFFDTEELTAVLRVLSAMVLIKATATVPSSLLMREMNFGPLARAELAAAVLGSTAGLIAVFVLESYWAIVWQLLVTESVLLALVVLASPRYRWRTSRDEVTDLTSFGIKLLGTNIVNFASGNGDNAIVGRFEGTEALGDYTLSYRVLSLPLQIVGQSAARTILPTFARLQDKPKELADIYYRSQRAISAVVVGPLILIAMAAPDLIRLVLNDDWLSATGAMRWIAISAIFQLGFGNAGTALVALNRPGWQFWWSTGTTVAALVGFLVGVQWGIEGVAASRTVIGIPAVLVGVAIVGRLIPVSPWRSVALLAPIGLAGVAAAMVYAAAMPLTADATTLVRIAVRGGLAGLAYVALIWLIKPVRTDLFRLFLGR
ncbi:MAG: lipopolysaccharide biosynthesis protein [Actinomycetota bacterium]